MPRDGYGHTTTNDQTWASAKLHRCRNSYEQHIFYNRVPLKMGGLPDDEIQTQISADAQMNQYSKILRSIPGIGPVVCAALIGEMPELGRIGGKQIAALAGIATINDDSGRTDGRRSIKGGDITFEVCCIRQLWSPQRTTSHSKRSPCA